MPSDNELKEYAVDPDNLKKIREEIFEQQQGGRGIRFTQDSPILPDAWLKFARDPESTHDLLINPCRGKRAGEVARDMRILLRNWRGQNIGTSGLDPAHIAHVPGLIVARLHFAELMRIVLPSTRWWEDRMSDLDAAFEFDGTAFDSSANAEQRLLFNTDQVATLKRWMESEWPSASSAKGDDRLTGTAENEPPYDFMKMVRVAAMVVAASKGEMVKGELKPPKGASKAGFLVDTFLELFQGWPADPKTPPTAGIIWSVTLNRRAEPAMFDSTKAMKADAGWLLFNISCKQLRWAVIDSGIDATHPAFTCRDRGEYHKLPPQDDPESRKVEETQGTTQEKKEEDRRTRVLSTYDFAELRMLLDPNFLKRLGNRIDEQNFELGEGIPKNPGAFITGLLDKVEERLRETTKVRMTRIPFTEDKDNGGITDEERTDAAIARRIRLVVDRIEEGLEIDWATIEPLIKDVTPDDPPRPHGTQVAGVLAADWVREDKDGKEDVRARGVCRDIRLIDLRVLSQDPGNDSELVAHDFEVISALKFIGYLNARADEPYVHGANVSISIAHDVGRFACGRTPICEEAERLVSSGVVVVAAAGNSGYANSDHVEDRFYRSGSITDPGNSEAVITVGSTHRQKPHQYGVSYFSSRGPTGDGRRKPDLVAPGEKIMTTSPGRRFARVDGTSFAAPHVSGAAAMLMARHTELIGQPARIKEILCSSATCLGREPYYQGAGMLDVLRALQSI